MSKQAYYFSHDSNARNDEKILAVRMKLGMEGYGIYWSILERMRENADYMCVKDYNIIAFDLRVSADKIKSLVEEFDLFQFTDDGKKFFSESFINRMSRKDEKSEKAKKAAAKRWSKTTDKQEVDADAMQAQSERNANGMPYKGKESKAKEKKRNTSPNGEDVYCAIDVLKNDYLKNQRLCNSVIENQRLKSKHQLSELLTDFNNHLDQLGTSNKTWQDYTSHFLNWMKKKINNPNANQKPATAPERF